MLSTSRTPQKLSGQGEGSKDGERQFGVQEDSLLMSRPIRHLIKLQPYKERARYNSITYRIHLL
ncbi:hypothetical protein M404DRAFT_1002494 [Pisolithus tinctorius Marx 270]|uniref:Uncharacterized protein n=1 Tax=Pisolithus tinctorius Marx 270 TaxID=870435 RepID=A0A0C3IZ28_PISTI|nr:hypothetical protein M404DRAFT_1002494 [Pisolithus tinctorius Marx 270]